MLSQFKIKNTYFLGIYDSKKTRKSLYFAICHDDIDGTARIELRKGSQLFKGYFGEKKRRKNQQKQHLIIDFLGDE